MALVFNERFEANPGYDETAAGVSGGWIEILGSGGSPLLDEDFSTSSVPGGAPTFWNNQCLKMVLGTTTPTYETFDWDSPYGTLYIRFDLLVGSFGGLTNTNEHFFRTIGSSAYPFSVDIRNTGGKYYLRCWYNNGANWQGPFPNATGYEITTNTKYRIDIKWIKNTASTGFEFKINGVSQGTDTSGNLNIEEIILGDVGSNLLPFEFYFDNFQCATDGWVPEDIAEGPTNYPRTIIGALPGGAGTVIRKGILKRADAGTFTGIGTIIRKGTVKRIESGSIASSGTILRIFKPPRKITGSLSGSIGSVIRKGTIKRNTIGAITSFGTIIRKKATARGIIGGLVWGNGLTKRMITSKRKTEGSL